MKKIITKSITTTLVFLLVVLIFLYSLIYSPLYKTLEETLLENFVNVTETIRISFEYIVDKEVENASSISSRTMIKNKIIEYKNGKVDLEELKSYTQPKYSEGIEALKSVVYSKRIVNNEIIASSGQKPVNINIIDDIDELSYEVFEKNDRIYLLAYSPIKSETVLGKDVILFDLSDHLHKMELCDMSINIIKGDKINKYQDKATINPFVYEHKASDDLIYLNVFYKLVDDMYLHINIDKDDFYYEFNNSTRKSLINLTLLFIFSFISINIMIILFASKKITSLDKSKEKYKHDSYYDTLTGAYSRLYLEQWLKDHKDSKLEYAVAFIDFDKFKSINDKYGHKKGDEVLKEIVSTIKNEIRDNDFVVRFGGDEFIILFKNASKDIAIKILDRINENIRLSILLEFKVSFSYGVGELKEINEFYDILEKIDIKMYEMKKNSKG